MHNIDPSNPHAKLAVVLCGLLCVLLFAWAGDTTAQGSDNPDNTTDQADPAEAQRWAQLDALLAKSPKPESIRATFVQKRTSLLLDKPVVSEGRFIAAGKVARLSLTQPAPLEMRFDDKRMHIYYPKDNVLEVYNVPQNSIAQTTGRPDAKRLAKDFKLTKISTDKASGLVTLTLEPKGDLTKHIQSLTLGFDPKLGLITAATTVDAAGDETAMALTDIKPGAKVEDAELELDVPDDARVEHPEGKPDKANEDDR